jgi:two-component system sensor histidine kinase UhpB
MSLRLRLIGLVAVVLVLSLFVGAAIAGFNASGSVGTEMRSALQVGRRAAETVAEAISAGADPQRTLARFVAAFDGNRHLRASLAGEPGVAVAPAAETSPFGEPPGWFARLIGVPGMTGRVAVAIPGRPDAAIVLETDPHNETLDVWNGFADTVIVLALFSGLTIALIYLFTGRALRPLYRLAAALEQIGQGDYGIRVGGRLTPELARLHDSFNRMAGRLAAADADNRRLTEQLLTVQERERGEIARDLHDEVGPYLFAINLDAAAVARLLHERRSEAALEHLRLIVESVDHAQRELRSAVRRLRPAGLAEFGLPAAIGDLIQFWRRRHPEIEFRVAVAPDCAALGELVDTTVYRIVQESVSNALRHGAPTRIVVRIGREAEDCVAVEVADDGTGMADAADPGFGLRGMAERVRALGGRLHLDKPRGSGLKVTARLPCRAQAGDVAP